MVKRINAIIQPRRGTAAAWAAKNPVLANGEIGFETDTNRMRKGDGLTRWNDLDPYLAKQEVQQLIAAGGGGGGPGPDLTELIAELADDGVPEGIVAGQSFELIYENRKV